MPTAKIQYTSKDPTHPPMQKQYLKNNQPNHNLPHNLTHNYTHNQPEQQTNNVLNQTMYNPPSQLPLEQKFWWQAFGMFFLIMLICHINPVYGFDFWISSILPVAIMLSVKQSGAHYNPSMSMSNFFIKFSPVKFSPFFMWTYFKAEFIPALLAYLFAILIKGYNYPPPIPHPGLTGLQILVSELIGTFMLVVLLQKIANTQTTFTTSDIETYSFVVVFVYIARRFAILSGNSINPVATFAFVCAAVVKCDFQYLQNFYLYLIGDFLGSCFGTWFFNHMLEPAMRISRKERQHQQWQKDQSEPLLGSILHTNSSQPTLTEVIREIEDEQLVEINKLTKIQHRSDVQSGISGELQIGLLKGVAEDMPPISFKRQRQNQGQTGRIS